MATPREHDRLYWRAKVQLGMTVPPRATSTTGCLLAGVIGVERELRQKHAGLRTHALVGLGAALFIEVSTYGFGEVLEAGRIVLDPSRVAAQVVTGIGFIGGGVIFVRQASVRGLTTAAGIWLAAAVGLACGAGMWIEAVAGTVLGLAVVDAVARCVKY